MSETDLVRSAANKMDWMATVLSALLRAFRIAISEVGSAEESRQTIWSLARAEGAVLAVAGWAAGVVGGGGGDLWTGSGLSFFFCLEATYTQVSLRRDGVGGMAGGGGGADISTRRFIGLKVGAGGGAGAGGAVPVTSQSEEMSSSRALVWSERQCCWWHGLLLRG